jgi:DNA-binding transcriptional LysR family regulator
MSGPSVEQLELLRELHDRGSLTAVAAALHKTPSAVSQQLKAVQRELGVPLVVRAGRGLQLTDAGTALAQSAVGVATALAEAEASWQRYHGAAAGTVRLACFHSAGELLVPGLLDRLRAQPAIRLETFDEDVSQDEFAGLTADYDVVVAHRSDDVAAPERPGLTVVPLLREPLDVAVPLGHPLAGRTHVTPADVIAEDWIAPPLDFPIDRVLSAIAARAGAPVRVVRRTTHLPLIERLVARGHGVALLPRHSTRQHEPDGIVLLPLRDLRAGRLVEALMRPDRAARRVVGSVVEQLVVEAAAVTAA